jgi:prepilin-type N-terminal cleavage/methylation domain-containing protein
MTRRGFTLIELLAAVFISSIVVTAAYTLMTSSTQNFNDESNRRLLKSNIRIAELLIQRDIARTGYMVPFDTKEAKQDKVRLWLPEGNMNQILAFNYHVSTNDNLKNYSGFTIVASLSDFLEFQIERIDTGRLCISAQLTMPLTASDIGNLGTNANPVAQNADENAFNAAFGRTFKRNTHAISIQNPTGKFITTRLDAPIDLPTDPAATCAYNIPLSVSNLPKPKEEGFEGSGALEGCNVFPVTAVSYFVANDSIIPNRKAEGRNNLMRCFNNPFNIETNVENLINQNQCQILISNIEYFEIFPLVNDGDPTNALFNRFSNSEAGGLTTNYNLGTQHSYWKDVKMSQLRGVYFRFGAKTDMPARSVNEIYDSGQNTYPSYAKNNDNEIFPLEHLQGVAPFRLIPSNDASSYVRID